MLDLDYSVDKIHEMTQIDKWFLYKLDNIRQMRKSLLAFRGKLKSMPGNVLLNAKKLGFSDDQIAKCVAASALSVRKTRLSHGIQPFVKRIDTLAGEVPTETNYLYTTYNAQDDDIPFTDHGVLVLGSGVYRIGSSVEFDWYDILCLFYWKGNTR
jgi:carbamoyl-phosphate synthase large subunit